MIVEIKWVAEEKDGVFILIRCPKPHQMQTPTPGPGKDALDRNHIIFQEYSEQHRRELNEYKKRVLQLHLGEAILTQDGK
jgi:hypothetical protein